MDSVMRKVAQGEVALGALMKGGPQLVSQLAQGGFDYVIPDMMFSGMTWREAQHMVDAAHASRIAAFVRVQAYPWSRDIVDSRLAVDSARALSLGADGVVASVSSADEVQHIVNVTSDWHRGISVTTRDELDEHEGSLRAKTRIFPLIESESAVEDLDKIFEVENLNGIFVGVTDLSKVLGHGFDYEHPDVWEVIDRVVALGLDRDVLVLANTGYIFADPDAIAARIERLHDHGVHLVMTQTVEFLLYMTARAITEKTRFEQSDGVVAGG